MSTSTSGNSRVSADLRTRLIARSKYRPGAAPSSGHGRTRGVLRGEYEWRRVLRREQGEVRRAGRRRAAPPFVASHALPTRQQGAPDMLSALAERGIRRPRRILIGALLTFVVAAVLGGPVAGRLDSANGFEDPASSSVAAREAIQQASGLDACTGSHRGGRNAGRRRKRAGRERVAHVARVLDGIPGVAIVRTPAGAGRALVARDGTSALVTATLRASADEGDVVAGQPIVSRACRASRSAAPPSPGSRSAIRSTAISAAPSCSRSRSWRCSPSSSSAAGVPRRFRSWSGCWRWCARSWSSGSSTASTASRSTR